MARTRTDARRPNGRPGVSPTTVLLVVLLVGVVGGGVVLALHQPAAAGALVGIGVLLVLRLRMKTLALVLVAACLLAPVLETGLRLDFLTYIDEATSVFLGVVVPLVLRLTGKKLDRLPGQSFLLITLALGLVSSVVAGVSAASTGQGAFLLLKMPLLAFGLAQLDWDASDARRIARWIVGLAIPVVGLSVAANVALGRTWVDLVSGGVGGYIDFRYGLLSSQGIFSHPLVLGNIAGILALGAFATSVHLPNIRFARVATVVALVASVASFRRTAIVGAFGALFLVWPKKVRVVLVVGGLVLVPLAALSLASAIVETFSNTLDEYVYTSAPAARTRLLLGAVQVAGDHAPLGAGFARYGSYLAGVEYSPEYLKLGFDNVWGLSNIPGMSGAFLTDTQWPVLVGETGWIGCAAFIVFLVHVYRSFAAAGLRRDPHLQWISTFGKGAFIVAAFASVGLPVFTSTPVASLLFTLLGISIALQRVIEPDGDAEEPEPAAGGARRGTASRRAMVHGGGRRG